MKQEKMSFSRKIQLASALAAGGLVLSAMSVFASDPTVSATDANTLIGAVIDLVKAFYFQNTLVAVAITLLVLIGLAFKVMRWLGHRKH